MAETRESLTNPSENTRVEIAVEQKKQEEILRELNNVPTEEYIQILLWWIDLEDFIDWWQQKYNTHTDEEGILKELRWKDSNLEREKIVLDYFHFSWNIFKVNNLKYRNWMFRTKEFKGILEDVGDYSEAYRLYSIIYDDSHQGRGFDVFSKRKLATYPQTLNNKSYMDYIVWVEEDFWESIDVWIDDFFLWWKQYGWVQTLLKTREWREYLSGFLDIIEKIFPWEFSLHMKLKIIFTYKKGVLIWSDFRETIEKKKELNDVLKEWWIDFPHHGIAFVNFLASRFSFSDTSELLDFFSKNRDIWKTLSPHLKFSYYSPEDLNVELAWLNHEVDGVLNNLQIDRFIKSWNDRKEWNYWISMVSIVERIEDDISDMNESKDEVLKDFWNFLQSFWISLTSPDAIFLVWRSYTIFREMTHEERTLLNDIKVSDLVVDIFPESSGFIADNLWNLLRYKTQDDIEKLKNFIDSLKDLGIKMDYIPSPSELRLGNEVMWLITTFQNEWNVSDIRLSDIYLLIELEKEDFFKDQNNSRKFLKLLELYWLVWDYWPVALRDILWLDLPYNSWYRRTYEWDIWLSIESIFQDIPFTFFEKYSEEIRDKIFEKGERITIEKLKGMIIYSRDGVYTFHHQDYAFISDELDGLWFSGVETREVLAFFSTSTDETSHWIEYYRYLVTNVKKEEDKLNKYHSLFKQFSEVFDKNPRFESQDLLDFIIRVDQGNSEFTQNIELLERTIWILQKYGVKLRSVDELRMFVRACEYDGVILEILWGRDFLVFFHLIKNKYFNGVNDIFWLIFWVEIYKFLQENSDFKDRILSKDFENVDETISYVESKFQIGDIHPSILNSVFRFSPNIKNTKVLISRLEESWEEVTANEVFVVDFVSKMIWEDNLKEDFLFNRDKLIESIIESIWSSRVYERKSQWMVKSRKNLAKIWKNQGIDVSEVMANYLLFRQWYTERPESYERLSLLKLWQIYVFQQWLINIDQKRLQELIIKDWEDTSTEVWGTLYPKAKWNKVYLEYWMDPSLSNSDESHVYWSSPVLVWWFNFHFHALGNENRLDAWPSWYWNIGTDFGYSYSNNLIWVTFTPIKWNQMKGIKVNTDMYMLLRNGTDPEKIKPNDFFVLDLGAKWTEVPLDK